MIEAYAFLAAFTMQILTMSVLGPGWVIRWLRAKAPEFPAERFAQQYPGVDHINSLGRYVTRYRIANSVIAVLGVLLLGWLFSNLQRPDWYDGPAGTLGGHYFMVQALPLLFFAWKGLRYEKLLEHLLERKRTAVLQRRGLFDYVSPFTVFLAALSYFLFVAYVFYIAQNPFKGFGGPLLNIGIVTLGFALMAFVMYREMYGKKVNPLETHAARMRTIGGVVKICVYGGIASLVAVSLGFTLKLQHLQRWEPFAGSAYYVFLALLMFMGFAAAPRPPEADGLPATAGKGRS